MKEITCTDNFTFKYNIAIVGVLVKMCQDCNTTIFIFAAFVVSLSLIHSVKCSVFTEIFAVFLHYHISVSVYVSLFLIQTM